MKKLILAGLLGLALGTAAVLGHNKLKADHAEALLNSVQYKEYPTCLLPKDRSGVYVVVGADEASKVYQVIYVALGMFEVQIEVPVRELNGRSDLTKVNCDTGEAL